MSAIEVVPHGIRLLAILCVVFAPAIEIAGDGSPDVSQDRNLVPPEGSRAKNAILPPS
jgi:hypothetical protein